MIKTENFEQVEITSSATLRKWLKIHHTQEKSIWLVIYKKETPDKYVSINEILDEILCFGWIDGIARKLDESRTMRLISPRRVKHWTKTYKDRFAKLVSQNKMTDAGLKSVEASKQAGLWDFMDDVDNLTKPLDFEDELDKYPEAQINWDNFGASSKRFMLRYIKIAKTPVTRTKRIMEISNLAKQKKKLPGS